MRKRAKDLATVEPSAPKPPAPAAVLPAHGNWRVVYLLERRPPAGAVLIHHEWRADLDAITGWALRAPVVVPGDPRTGEAPASTLGEAVCLIPMVGEPPALLPQDAHFFEIVGPDDPRTNAQLLQQADDYLVITDQRTRK